MKKGIAFLFLLIFLAFNVSQICKNIFTKNCTVENIIDNENDEEKKSAEDYSDFLKDKIFTQNNSNIHIATFQLKQYIEHIFQYKNPHHEVDIIPPEQIIFI